MHPLPSLDSIPRGATARGVNRAVVEYLLQNQSADNQFSVLDIPCGQGEFMATVRAFFPQVVARGCDLTLPSLPNTEHYVALDASRPFAVFEGTQFDYVISISGVMEFDNTLQYFESCQKHLRDTGRFIVTNDNLLTLRDRMEYLLFGKFRQYSAFMVAGEPTWKIVPLQNMLRTLHDAGFNVLSLTYVSMKPKDWLWLPLGLLVYPFQWLYLQLKRSGMPIERRLEMHPFVSLFYRHYILVCEKRQGSFDTPGKTEQSQID